jgi:predicted dehydrogenase
LKAIRNSGNGIVTAVASRDAERSRASSRSARLAALICAPSLRRLRSAHRLKDVDAASFRCPPVCVEYRAAEAGKHVICESLCHQPPHLRRYAACHANRVQFMDGVMFMHSRRLEAIRHAQRRPSIGRSNAWRSGSALGPAGVLHGNIRAHGSLEPDGCLRDLGWYCIRFALWIMQGQLPRGRGPLLSSSAGDKSHASAHRVLRRIAFDGGVSRTLLLIHHGTAAMGPARGTKGSL